MEMGDILLQFLYIRASIEALISGFYKVSIGFLAKYFGDVLSTFFKPWTWWGDCIFTIVAFIVITPKYVVHSGKA